MTQHFLACDTLTDYFQVNYFSDRLFTSNYFYLTCFSVRVASHGSPYSHYSFAITPDLLKFFYDIYIYIYIYIYILEKIEKQIYSYIFIYIISYDRYFAFAYFIVDPYKSSYKSFDVRIKMI